MNTQRFAMVKQLCCFFILLLNAFAQIPSPKQYRPIYLIGATIHTGSGEVIENGIIGFADGKITVLQQMSDNFQPKEQDAMVLNVTGKHVYPGFIAMNTTLGLREIDAVRATRDERETGDLNPNVRAIVAFNVDSKIIPTIRSNGVLLAQIVPQGLLVTGQSSVVQLDAWTWEHAAIVIDNGLHIVWPIHTVVTQEEQENRKNSQIERLEKIRQLFHDALAYCNSSTARKPNLKLQALCDVFNGKKKLYVHTNDAKGILTAIAFCKEFGIRPVIVGGLEADKVLDILRRDSIPVVLTAIHRLPGRPDAPIDQPFRLPALLAKNSILFAIAASGTWEQRNLPFHVGTAIGYGLPYEEGVKAITANAAKILGIDSFTGILQPGYDATFIVTDGDAFDIRSSSVHMAFIQGRRIDLNNTQKELYEKYLIRYGLDNR